MEKGIFKDDDIGGRHIRVRSGVESPISAQCTSSGLVILFISLFIYKVFIYLFYRDHK